MASSGLLPSRRSASRAKSIIMMAFFFTMPISRMMPISAMTLKSVRQIISASSAPTPAEGRVERIVIGMNVAFVEHAEDDVDGHERRKNQKWLVDQRGLKGLRRSLKAGLNARRQIEFLLDLVDGGHSIAQ